MSRDVQVYAKKKTTVPIKDILARLRDLGIAAEWKADPLAEVSKKSARQGAWRAGVFVPEGDTESQTQIVVTNESLKKDDTLDVIEGYDDVLTEAQRKQLKAAQTLYWLRVGWLENPERERLLAGLAYALAELGDGVILDTQTNRFYDRDEYRRRYSQFFKK